jgi:membrane protease YdiL (CAAX protease family)
VLIGVLALLVAAAAWSRVGPARVQPVTGPLLAVLVVLISGLSWGEAGFGAEAGSIGWAAAGAGLVAAGYAVALAIPSVRRRAFPPDPRDPAYTALVAVPLATVIFEEVAFRGVLWGLIVRDHGVWWAGAVTSVLFGLWHARPRRDRPLVVLGSVLFTTAAGVVFAVLRHQGGNLLAPVAVHWAANGLGVLASAWVWRRSR